MSNQYGKHCLKQTVSFNMRYSSVVICFYFCFCFWVFFYSFILFFKIVYKNRHTKKKLYTYLSQSYFVRGLDISQSIHYKE